MITANPFTVVVDMDGIIVYLTAPWLDAINRDHRLGVSVDDIDVYDMTKVARLVGTNPLSYLRVPGLYENAPAIPGAISALNTLHQQGFRVIVATDHAAGDDEEHAHNVMIQKYRWLARSLPWLHLSDVMFESDKTKIPGDVFIDDKPKSLEQYTVAYPDAAVMGIEWPYNRQVNGVRVILGEGLTTIRISRPIRLAKDYRNTIDAWCQLVEWILKVAAEWTLKVAAKPRPEVV